MQEQKPLMTVNKDDNADMSITYGSYQQDELDNDDLILHEAEATQKISADILNLLITFNLKKEDFDQMGIKLEDIERVLDPHFLRQFFRFLMSTSIIRTLLLWPWLNKNSIKLDGEISEHSSLISSDHDSKRSSYHTTTLEYSDNENSLMKISDSVETSFEELDSEELITQNINTKVKNLAVDNHDTLPLAIQNDKNNEKKINPWQQKLSCRLPLLTTYALLFESQMTQKSVYALTAFYATAEESFDGIWSLLYTSLLIQGVFNFYQYPEEYVTSQFTLIDILGLSTPIGNEYQLLLAKSLNNPYILSFILGLPTLFGMVNAIRAAQDSQALDYLQVEALVIQLKDHKPGFWSDGLGWVFWAALPDAFPPLAMCALIPQPLIKQTLEKIKQRVLWDGRLSSKDRLALFNELELFAQQNSRLTQMKALSMLAEVVNGINIQNLSLLKEEGVDEENIKALLLIKIRAFQSLDFLANHYNLPTAPWHLLRPLPRYVYTNYLMWNLGYPQHWYLQPLFLIYKTIKLYFTVQFYTMLLAGIDQIINYEINGRACSILPNFVWRGENKKVECFESYLRTPRTFEELIKLIELYSSFSDDDYYHSYDIPLDLSYQTKIIQQKKLPDFLRLFSEAYKLKKMSLFHSFILKNNKLSIEDMKSIGDFLLNSTRFIQTLDFSNAEIESGGMFILLQAFENYTYHSDKINLIFEGNPLNDSDIAVLLNILSYKYDGYDSTLNLKACNITSSSCIALAEKLLQIQTEKRILTKLNLADNRVNSDCAEIIAKIPIYDLDLSGNNRIDDRGIEAFANKTNIYMSSLSLSGYNVSDDNLIMLINALPQFSPPNTFSFYYTDNQINRTRNYSRLIPQLIQSLYISDISRFGWNSPQGIGFGDEGTKLLANAIAQSSISRTLRYLDLSENQIGPEGIQALSQAMIIPSNGNIELVLRNNYIGSGISALAEAIIKKITSIDSIHWSWHDDNKDFSLDLSKNNITASDIHNFTNLINVALGATGYNLFSLRSLNLAENFIGNQGVIDLGELIRKDYTGGRIIKDDTVRVLNLSKTNISDLSAKIPDWMIATIHPLWIETLTNNLRNYLHYKIFDLSNNFINDSNAEALCAVFADKRPKNEFVYFDHELFRHVRLIHKLILAGNPINETILQNCGFTSDSHSLKPTTPYFLMIRFYRSIRHLISDVLLNQYNEPYQAKKNSDQQSPDVSATFISKPTLSVLDASHYQGSNSVIINLDSSISQKSCIGDEVISTSPDTVAAKGSIHSNNVMIGGEETLLDVSQTRRTNFLQAGKNNQLRLGFFSQDHVVVAERQGIVQIESFESKDTLHLISKHTVYNIETNITICQNEIIENNMPAAVIRLPGTTIELQNTRCEDIENNIEINNDEAIYAAQREVMDSTENQQSILYTSLLNVCQTFLNSVSKSAMFTAAPAFAAEILYRSGGYTREETERFGEELQKLLILSFADSPQTIAASFLASWLVTKLTHSPTIISTVGIGASIVTSVASTVLSTDVTLGWMALQTGVALMGSVLGSHGVRWGINQASNAKEYLSSRIGFWSSPCPPEAAKVATVLQLEIIPEQPESRSSLN